MGLAKIRRMRPRLAICCLALCLANSEQAALAHGGVVLEDDLCVINIGYLQAHFKIYLPGERQRQEFCEDIPSTGESLFVMEYLHSGLDDASIDFRVIRNVTGLGRFALWEDVARIADLDEITVFHHAPAVVPGVYSVVHRFDEPGEFIGIVTAVPNDASTPYTAVFPFEVGFTGFGVWPLVLIAIAILQLHLWHSSGRLKRWLGRFRPQGFGASAVLVCGIYLASEAHGNQAIGLSGADSRIHSRSGHFQVSVAPDLEPLAINTIHRWVVLILAADGAPVPSAEITVRGGMPAHDHGLPTLPEATRYLGEGRYLIEGMRFHMAGRWEVVLSIETDALHDEVVIPLEL